MALVRDKRGLRALKGAATRRTRRRRVSAKIRLLKREGKSQNQAVAQALDMERRGKLS